MRALLKRLWTSLFGYDIFLSYRRQDAEAYVAALGDDLQKQGFACYLDRQETMVGARLDPAIHKALKRSRVLVVVLTPGVLASDWIRQEIRSFQGRVNRLIPINVGGFLADHENAEPPFRELGQLSWIDETTNAVSSGRPSPSIADEIATSFRWRRVRTYARMVMAGLIIALLIGAWSVGQFVIDGRRQAEIVYEDIDRTLDTVTTMLLFMRSAATDFERGPLELVSIPPDSPAALESLVELDLAEPRLFGPLIGFEPISPPGDQRSIVKILSAGAEQIAAELDRLQRQNLPLVDDQLLALVDALGTDAFLLALAEADDKLARYHRIEDSDIAPFYLLGNPAVAGADDYLAFLEKTRAVRAHLERVLPRGDRF